MKKILLYKRHKVVGVAEVDDVDYLWLNRWIWRLSINGYAVRGNGLNKISMHRIIVNTPQGMETDHIDRNRLNNQRNNLRIVTRSQNAMNRKKVRNTSGCKGVYWHKKKKRWEAYITLNRKVRWLGQFVDFVDAVKARHDTEKELFGDFSFRE